MGCIMTYVFFCGGGEAIQIMHLCFIYFHYGFTIQQILNNNIRGYWILGQVGLGYIYVYIYIFVFKNAWFWT